jgi:hypothetical protein
MRRKQWFAVLAATVVGVLLARPVGVRTAPFTFTHAPFDFTDTSGVVPLGSLNPGDNHVLPVDHMYVNYPVPDGGGTALSRVLSMARGKVVMIVEEQSGDRPDPDYGIFIRHTATLTSYFLHVHVLNANLDGYVRLAPAEAWIEIRPEFRILLPGQRGADAAPALHGGEFVGFTKNYSHAWDIGVIDSERTGDFIGRGARRYPTLGDYMRALGIAGLVPPYRGQETLNAQCFLDYLPEEIAAAYSRWLTGPNCGRAGWDVAGRLRGAWFNRTIDEAATPPVFQLETGALSVVPDVVEPDTYVRIAFGAGSEYSAFDPARALPQLRNAFRIEMSAVAGARINPDPATTVPGGGPYCYDLRYDTADGPRFNSARFYMPSPRRLRIRYDPTPHLLAQCADMPKELPDATWADYVR